MWPHFFSEASWSSKWTPAAPASMNAFMISKLFSGPPKPASASATMGRNQSRVGAALGVLDLVGALQGAVDAPAELRRGVGRIEALVGVHGPGGVVVGRHLPAGEIDRLQAGAGHLHRLVAGDRAQGVDVGLCRQRLHSRLAPRSARVWAIGNEPRSCSTSAGGIGPLDALETVARRRRGPDGRNRLMVSPLMTSAVR